MAKRSATLAGDELDEESCWERGIIIVTVGRCFVDLLTKDERLNIVRSEEGQRKA
jgi:hypothetical protein